MYNCLLNFWNCLQIILLKCLLEKITILSCVSTRDWKRKKSSMLIQQINIQFIWCLWCIFKKGAIFIGDTSQVTFHTWEMEVWISTDWIIILICHGTYIGMTGITGLLGLCSWMNVVSFTPLKVYRDNVIETSPNCPFWRTWKMNK